MELLENILIFLLIFTFTASIAGVLCYGDYLKKFACLTVCYGNFLVTLIVFFKNSQNAEQIFEIASTILILFSITLAVGVGIVFKLQHQQQDDSNT